jgi:hypothetical protein
VSKYTLTLETEQLQVLVKSLDLYARIQMGQVSQLTNPYLIPLPDADYTDVEDKLLELKKAMFPELPEKSYYSIKSKKVADPVRQAVDMLEVINHRLAWDNFTPTDEHDKPVGEVYKNPFHWSSEIDLPHIEKVGAKNDTNNN